MKYNKILIEKCSKLSDYKVQLLISYLLLFFWYYVTLPGSILLSKNDNTPKPKLDVALKKFILYTSPQLLLGGYILWICHKITNNK